MPTREEINFTTMWLACADERDEIHEIGKAHQWFMRFCDENGRNPWPHATTIALCVWMNESPPPPDQPWRGYYALTPRGRDLVETARVAGIPDRADDEPASAPAVEVRITCPRCNGRRRVDSLDSPRDRTIVELVEGEPAINSVSLPGWDYACPRCHGKGTVEAVVIEAAAPGEWAIVRELASSDADGWRPLTVEHARALAGETVEIRNAKPAGGAPGGPWFVEGTCANSVGHVAWFRPAPGNIDSLRHWFPCGPEYGWEVRVVEPEWVTDRDAMLALLREAHETGRRVECQWDREGTAAPKWVGGCVYYVTDCDGVAVVDADDGASWGCAVGVDSGNGHGHITAVRFEVER